MFVKKEKEATPPYRNEKSQSVHSLKTQNSDEQAPPIPPLPTNYRRSDGKFILLLLLVNKKIVINLFSSDEENTTNETKNELKKLRAMSKASKQAELKR